MTCSALRTEKEFDFVIIGSGFGGSVSAIRLTQKRYSVAILETGTARSCFGSILRFHPGRSRCCSEGRFIISTRRRTGAEIAPRQRGGRESGAEPWENKPTAPR
jgi:choline dehydrogenase-like flavoprotein